MHRRVDLRRAHILWDDEPARHRLVVLRVIAVVAGRSPKGNDLASQPTLSRFENALGPKPLMQMGTALADTVVSRHRKRLRGQAKRITVAIKAVVN